MVFWPFLSTFYLPWATGLAGLWISDGSLRCWTRSTVDRKNGPLHRFYFNPHFLLKWMLRHWIFLWSFASMEVLLVPLVHGVALSLSSYSITVGFLHFFQNTLLPKYQPKRGGDLGWGKLFRFKCGIKNYFQLVKTNLRTQFNCNIDMIENQTQAYISNWISKR